MGAPARNSSKSAFIIRILIESLRCKADPRVTAIRRLLEAGFTGMRVDKRGAKRYYRDGRQVANPTPAEKKALASRGQRALPSHQRISHDEAKQRIGAIGPNTHPDQIKALANDLMNMSYADLVRIKQDLGARGGWGSKAKMTDRLQQGVTRNELPTAKRNGLQAVRVKRSADGKGIEVDPTGESNRIAWQTPDGKLHSTAIGAYGHLKQNQHLLEPKATQSVDPQALQDALKIHLKSFQIADSKVDQSHNRGNLASSVQFRNDVIGAFAKKLGIDSEQAKDLLVAASKGKVPEQPQEPSPAKLELTRAKPRSLITFGKPITGPSGATIGSYQWQHKLVDDEDQRDGEATRRVSDWTKAINNVETSREIVHHFKVTLPDGSSKVVSLESALKLLGYQPGDAGAAKIRNTASGARALAVAQMQLALAQQAAQNNERIKAEVAKMEPPEMTVEKGMFLGSPSQTHDTYRMGNTTISRFIKDPLPEDTIRRDLTDSWRKKQVIAAGGDPYDLHKVQAQSLRERVKSLEKKVQASATTAYNQPNPEEDSEKAAPAPADQGFTGIDAEGRKWRNGELVAKTPDEPAKDEQAQQEPKPSGEAPVPSPEPDTATAPSAPEKTPRPKRQRKSRAKMTILGIVAKQGGITPQSVKAMANYKEQVIQGGLLHAIRSNGIDIGKMAETLERQGHFRTPPDRHADDYMLELMANGTVSQLAEEKNHFDKEQEEYYKALEAAKGEHNERDIEAARGRGEEAGRKEGEDSGVSEVSGWDQPDAQGAGADEEDYDRSEPASGAVDASFDFGANAEEPQQPEPPPPAADQLGFTGTDAQGREWRNGELVAKQEEPAGTKPAADLFGNPLPDNKPKAPETMPGLFGEPVPIGADKPQSAPEPTTAGTDNPLDRPDAAKKDDTQDMFGLFGPGTKAKIDQVNNGTDVDPMDEPSTPAAAAAEPRPNDTPRTQAARVSAAMDADYENARASTMPNLGADIKGSARHKAMEWKGLKDAEKNGTAEALVKRDVLLKQEPSKLSEILKGPNFVSVLAGHLILQSFPKDVHDYEKYTTIKIEGNSSPEQLRAQYYEAFTEIKKLVEEQAATATDAREMTRKANQKIQELIAKFRKKDQENSDRFNPVANSLINMQNILLGRGSKSVIGRVHDFGKRLQNKYGEPSPEMVGKAIDHVMDILEGDSFNQTFDTVQSDTNRFNAADYYVKYASRKGGRAIDDNINAGQKFIMESVGMRGVQWGNTVTDEERKHHLHKSCEAMADLADMTGLPDHAMSLSGQLGLAIGARGIANALAHYEPKEKVINLTRKNGVGSLAHEWAHALDDYIGGGNGNYLSNTAAYSGTGDQTPRIAKAMHTLLWELQKTGYHDRLANEVRRKFSGSRAKSDYWKGADEIFARLFEVHIKNKLEKSGRKNTYLAGVSPGELWPTIQEAEAVAPYMEDLMQAIKEKNFKKTTEAVMPTDKAAKIALVQAIISQTGAKPPRPKQAQEAQCEEDPRVKRIRELLAQRG